MNSADVDKLSKLYMFKQTPRRSLDELCALAPPVHFPRGHTVFTQGAEADLALLLIDGRLVALVSQGRDEREVGDVRAGEIVGEQGLFVPGGKRSATVKAAEASTCLLLSTDVMDHAFHNPAIVALERYMLGTLARRIRNTNQGIQKAWKEAPLPDDDAPKSPSLRDRLASLFGGR